jgi:adenine phosphoribosyltransferase
MESLRKHIRDIPGFPKEGIVFRDITPLIGDYAAFEEAVDELAAPFESKEVDLVLGIESRGFIFGGAVALTLGAGFLPARKPGKLPAETVAAHYELEYGTDSIELHADAVTKGQRVLIVDDLMATGGTAAAAVELVEKLGGEVVGLSFLIELTFLDGRKKIKGYDITSLIRYDTE